MVVLGVSGALMRQVGRMGLTYGKILERVEVSFHGIPDLRCTMDP